MKRILVSFSTLGLAVSFVMSPLTMSSSFAQNADAQATEKQEEEEQSAEELMAAAQRSMDRRDYKAAAELFQKVVKLEPQNGSAWHLRGYALHMVGDLDTAMKAHTKASKMDDPQAKMLGLYNMACVHALQDRPHKAFECLNKSVDAGFRDQGQLRGDGDMDSLRDDPRYAEIVTLIKNDGKRPAAKKKAPSLAGTWKVTSGVVLGDESTQLPLSIKVTKDEISIATPESTFIFSYELDTTQTPIQIDMTIVEGPQPDAKAKGIIKIDGDKFTLCYHPMGGDRPKQFKSTEENQFHLFVMKREVVKITTGSLVGQWKFVSGTNGGEKADQETLDTIVKIEKDKVTLPAGPEKFVMSYKIDATKSPAEIDMKMISGPGAQAGSPAIGILKSNGANVVICYDPTGAKRPKAFESTEEDQFHLFEIKKIVID
ncbi:MAG: hypothetical protein ACI87E_003330 [Mariniblastus sp.]|jgi:uncharacterized protein (TIGR03067 family)